VDEDFEETVTTTHEEIRHLGKAGWKSTLTDGVSIANQKNYGV
jgi:hypothetical protein